jgi:parallel beta-helix repeat protein
MINVFARALSPCPFKPSRRFLGVSRACFFALSVVLTVAVLGDLKPALAADMVATNPAASAKAAVSPLVVPGPNAALAPFYSCRANFYVSTTGKDSNSGAQASPWRTIQHADSSARKAGDCINVAAGTYTGNLVIQHGGNAPTATGYVVYRCQSLDKCHILANSSGHLWGLGKGSSFTVVDGFELDGNNALKTDGLADACIGSDGATYGTGQSAHHIWVLNNIIHHCNLAGVSLNNKEWYYVMHNIVYHNAYTSGYQGSGIGLVVVQCIEKNNANCASGSTYKGGTGTYTPSGMDLTYAPPFHIVVSNNIAYSNMIARNNPVPCGSHTDGNGIIMDTFYDQTTNTIAYPYRSLVFGNVSYGNGGRGIHVFRTSNVTVMNNTAYGNGTDTCINAYYLADLSQSGGSNNVWTNNIAQSVLTAANTACGSFCGHRNTPLVAGKADSNSVDSNNSYSHNILYGGYGAQLFDNDAGYFSCSKNKCNTNPQLLGPTAGNFALQTTSPAIGYALTGSATPDVGACTKALVTCY